MQDYIGEVYPSRCPNLKEFLNVIFPPDNMAEFKEISSIIVNATDIFLDVFKNYDVPDCSTGGRFIAVVLNLGCSHP